MQLNAPTKVVKALVCGGRKYDNKKIFNQVMESIAPLVWSLACGGAKGADQLAIDWAYKRKIPCNVFQADWETHKKAAGAIRNQEMLNVYKPDIVVAFPGGAGTYDMMQRALKAGVQVLRIRLSGTAVVLNNLLDLHDLSAANLPVYMSAEEKMMLVPDYNLQTEEIIKSEDILAFHKLTGGKGID